MIRIERMEIIGKGEHPLLKRWRNLLLLALILIGGCEMDSKAQPEKLPDTVAFQDEFTREFMVSPKEVKKGYYLFKSKTGGYTMLYPKNAIMDKMYYEKHENYFEDINFGESNKKENIAYFVRITYENKAITNNIDTNLKLLSNSVNYNGNYTEFQYEDKTFYYAKTEKLLSNGKSKAYTFFSYIKSNKSNQGIEFIYGVSCLNFKQKCNIDLTKEEENAKKLIKSIEFLH
jgi:hypothetical protein